MDPMLLKIHQDRPKGTTSKEGEIINSSLYHRFDGIKRQRHETTKDGR